MAHFHDRDWLRPDSQEGTRCQVSVRALRQTLQLLTGMEMDTLSSLCVRAECAWPSQHRGLHDDLGVLDVPFALDHPQLQLSRAGLLSFSCFGCRTRGRSEQA